MTYRLLFAVVTALSLAGARPEAGATQPDGDLTARGAFTCDFGLPANMPFDQVPAILERDRTFMSARRGFVRKLVPLGIDPFTGDLSSGGRYLFDSKQNADAYRDWVTNDFVLDGVPFFDRPYFIAPDCHSWEVVGAHDFSDIHTSHAFIRTERWQLPAGNDVHLLKDRWPAIRAAADARGLASVWLLYNKHEDMVSLVYVSDHIVPATPYAPDFISLMTIASAPPLGAIFDDQPWARTFDRTQFTLTIWFPFQEGDTGEPSLWPNSPPFPQPGGSGSN